MAGAVSERVRLDIRESSSPRAESGPQQAPQLMAPRLPEPQQFGQGSQGCGVIVVSCAGTGAGINGLCGSLLTQDIPRFYDSPFQDVGMVPRRGRCYP